MKYLGIDYGRKRVGVALSDANGRLAMPYAVVKRDTRIIESVAAIVRDEVVQEIVVGESVDQNGHPNPLMKDIEEFATRLGEYTSLPLHFEKEWMTSVHARQSTGDEGSVDASAAALILQRYLDKKNA